MCALTALIAPKCRHPIQYEYKHCAESPYPKRCPDLVDSAAKTVMDENHAFCAVCWKQVKEKMTAEFHAERRMITSMARAEGRWGDDEISQMREELRDQYYEKLRYGNRAPLALPGDKTQGPSSSATSNTPVGTNSEEANEIRAQLKEWTYKKLDYVYKPLPAEPIPVKCSEQGRALWLERDDSGVQLRYVDAPHYGGNRAKVSQPLIEKC